MRPIHGAAVRTLTSEARGCKLLNGGAKRSKDGTCIKRKVGSADKRERLETLNGAEQTTAPMDGAEGGHGRCDTEMELIAKAAVGEHISHKSLLFVPHGEYT